MVPFDTKSQFITSGVRIGTAALTTRGMVESQMVQIAGWIHEVLSHIADESVQRKVRAQVNELCNRFPLYQQLLVK